MGEGGGGYTLFIRRISGRIMSYHRHLLTFGVCEIQADVFYFIP